MVSQRREYFESKIEKVGDCWLWTGSKDYKGYGRFWGGKSCVKAHRFSYELYVGKIDPEKIICHSCDTPSCVNPEHLWQGTHADNAWDREKKGRGGGVAPMGSSSPKARLNEEDVIKIRKTLSEGQTTHRAIAKQYGVHYATISDLATGKTWRHV